MKVTIKTFEELEETEDVVKVPGGFLHKNGSWLHQDMNQLYGKKIEVLERKNSNLYLYDYNGIYGDWLITEWMIK